MRLRHSAKINAGLSSAPAHPFETSLKLLDAVAFGDCLLVFDESDVLGERIRHRAGGVINFPEVQTAATAPIVVGAGR
jgi:hypothetical protein